MLKKMMTTGAVAALVLAAAARERGIAIVQDDFDTTMTFAEKWIPKGAGIRSDGGRALVPGGSLRTRGETPVTFFAEADFTLSESPAGAAAGFQIEGLRFTVRPDGTAGLLKGGALEKPLAIEGFVLGKAVKLGLLRKVADDKAVYVFRVNGKDAATAEGDAMSAKTLEIFSDNAKLELDDFALYTVKAADESPNLIINGGFEVEQDGFPLYVCRSSTFDYAQHETVPYERYLATWSLDTTEKHGGRQSLRLENTDFTGGQSLMMHSAGTVPDRPGVFSVWMKANQDEFPVFISYGKRKEVMVGREWKRYEVVNEKLPKPGIYSPVWIQFSKNKGVLWVDDMQAEVLDAIDPAGLAGGKPLATPFQPSVLDQERMGKKEPPERTPEITVPRLPAGLVPGGDLDAWKDKAVKLDKFYAWTKSPQNKTDAYLACDDRNFYVGVRAGQKDLSKVNTDVVRHDTWAIGNRDAVEMLIDPPASGASFQYYQFLALPGGSRADRGMGMDSSWNGEWSSVVRVDEENSRIDYAITIPFASLASPAMKSRWLMNIHRYDMSVNEAVTLMRAHTPSFRTQERWPFVQFPEEVITPYRVGASGGGYTEAAGAVTVSLDMMNLTGGKLAVKAEFSDAQGDAGVLGSREITLQEGAGSLVFESPVKTEKVRIRFYRGGAMLSDQMIALEKRDLITMTGRLNYYMKEKEAPFRIATTVPDPETLTAVLSLGKTTVRRPAAARFTIALPLAKVADGEHEVKLALMKDGRTVAEGSATLVKRPYKEGAAQVNHFARCLMHEGKPVFMSAPFLDDLSFCRRNKAMIHALSHRLAFFTKRGFRHSVVMTLYVDETNSTVNECRRLLDEANKAGVKVVLMTKYNLVTDGKVDEVIKQLDFPNVMGQIVTEEPELSAPSDVIRDFLRTMRPKFPYQPTIMCNTVLGIPSRYANLETDVLMIDDYLTNARRTVASVVEQTDAMWKAGAADGKPCWYFVVGGNFPLHPREPSYGEQIAQCYGNIAAGCSGISFFYGNFQTPGNWRAVQQINREILALADVLCSEEEAAEVFSTGDPKMLRVRTKLHDGHLYLITCNVDENPAGVVTFTIPPQYRVAGGSAEVMFEDRKVDVSGNSFADTFEGHARHVYKLKIRSVK